MTRKEITEGLRLLEDNMVYFDELLNDKGKWIDVHELLFEAIEVLEREFCEDAIDRAEAMTEIMMFAGNVKSNEEDVYIKVSDAVQLLRELPPVNPQESKYCDRNICTKNEYNGIGCDKCEVTKSQEPFINKPCVSKGVCEHDKNVALDKIRAEIEFIPTIEWKDDGTTYILASYFKKQVLEIIDKYTAESEE